MSNNEQPKFEYAVTAGRFLAIGYYEGETAQLRSGEIADLTKIVLQDMALADSLGYEVISITPTHIFMQRERNYEESQLRADNERKAALENRAMLRKRNGGFLYGDFVRLANDGSPSIGEVVHNIGQIEVRWPDETDFTKSHFSIHDASELILVDDNQADSNER